MEQMAKKDKLLDEQKELIKELNSELDYFLKDQSYQRDMLCKLRDRVNTHKSQRDRYASERDRSKERYNSNNSTSFATTHRQQESLIIKDKPQCVINLSNLAQKPPLDQETVMTGHQTCAIPNTEMMSPTTYTHRQHYQPLPQQPSPHQTPLFIDHKTMDARRTSFNNEI